MSTFIRGYLPWSSDIGFQWFSRSSIHFHGDFKENHPFPHYGKSQFWLGELNINRHFIRYVKSCWIAGGQQQWWPFLNDSVYDPSAGPGKHLGVLKSRIPRIPHSSSWSSWSLPQYDFAGTVYPSSVPDFFSMPRCLSWVKTGDSLVECLVHDTLW